MSEGVVIALITAAGSLLGGVVGQSISSSALVRAAQIKKADGPAPSIQDGKAFSWGGLWIGVVLGAGVMLCALFLLGFFPAERNDIDAISGTWSGVAKNGDSDLNVRFIIGKSCKIGQVCGTFDFPSLPFSGTITITKITGTTYEFQAKNPTGDILTPGVQDSLQLLPDGTILYVSKGSSYGETRGLLYKSQ